MARPVILDSRGDPIRRDVSRGLVRGKYDAAQTTEETSRHWAWADALSARSANTPDVRLRLRTRSRYEAANNSYAAGMAATLASDLIGTGPRLQMTSDDAEVNHEIEEAWCEWSKAVRLAEKLRTMRRSLAVDGEAFALLTTNERLTTPSQLDIRLVEADQVATPYPSPIDPWSVDGIILDADDNPIAYHLLRVHPGDGLGYFAGSQYDAVPASLVIHWFRVDRPQQYRGVPEFTPALNLFAQLRRYTLAVLAAAETAADFAAVLGTELPPDGEEDEITPFTSTPIERRMMTTLPAGYSLSQLKAEQPTTTYEMFKRELLNEIARCLSVPYNIAAGNSSSYNYSSARLDHQTYYRSLGVDRSNLEVVALDRIFGAWVQEMRLASDVVSKDADLSHRWLWPEIEYGDPQEGAKAAATKLGSYLTTFSDECQKQGVDPESRARTIARDVALFKSLGLPSPYQANQPTAPAAPRQAPGDNTDDDAQDDPGDGTDRADLARVHRNGFARP